MKHLLLILLFVLGLNVLTTEASWGFWAHKRINRVAVFTLPTELIGFFKENLEYVTQHAVDPDKRRYAVEDEAPKHYIDIDHYCEWPHTCVPRKWEDAVEVFTEDTLKKYGTSPWNLEKEYRKMVNAFKAKDSRRILKYCSDFGHYVGDLHVPLHTTLNYNGQLSGQKGIHGFWESRIPELFGEDYDYFVGRAEYIEDVPGKIWEIVLSSSAAVDSVLSFEANLTEEFPADQKFSFEDRGELNMQTYSFEFSDEYNKMMDDMSHRRLRMTVINLGSFWYSAWVDAGSPDLTELMTIELTEEELEKQKELDKQFRNGKIKGRDHWE